MLTSDKERRICEKYSAVGEDGKVRCGECPLSKSEGSYDFRCKGWCHYNPATHEWEPDETMIDEEEAIAILQEDIASLPSKGDVDVMKHKDALMAAIECLRKRRPAAPIIGKMTFPSGEYILEIRCPVCHKHIVSFASDTGEWFSGEKSNVCGYCGKTIDWSGVSETVRKYSYS